MGTRNFSRREPKKPKKGTKKTTPIILIPQETVEVIKKAKKESPPTEE